MIETIRDLFFIVYLGLGTILALVALVAIFFIAKATFSVIRSIKRTLGIVEDLVSTIREKVEKPLSSGSGMSYALSTVLRFVQDFRHRKKAN